MSLHIGEMTSTVVPQPEPQAAAERPDGPGWSELERIRQAQARLTMIVRRTRAEDYDD